MTATLNIPPLYELVMHDSIDSAASEARRLALSGADEGTLVWVKEQTAGRGRFDHQWFSEPGNLHCAIILRPDEPMAVAGQINYVAAVSLATAIAGLVTPMTELRYRWPNDLLLNNLKMAGILLDSCVVNNGNVESLVLGVNVNVKSHPKDLDDSAANMHADGFSKSTDAELLESFSRNFLSWINRWAEEGFGPIGKAWIQRANGIGQPIELQLAKEVVSGEFVELDSEGALVVKLADDARRKVTVAEFFCM
jgi:BirA family biotin operon repressor/biotin-[acetyl-CoA-carboxylase] ligase